MEETVIMVRKQRSIRPPKFIERLSLLTLGLLALTCLAYFLNSPAESTGRELRSSLCVIEDDDNDRALYNWHPVPVCRNCDRV